MNYDENVIRLLSSQFFCIDEMENAPAILKDIQQNGLRPSLSSGLQAAAAPAAGKNIFN